VNECGAVGGRSVVVESDVKLKGQDPQVSAGYMVCKLVRLHK